MFPSYEKFHPRLASTLRVTSESKIAAGPPCVQITGSENRGKAKGHSFR
jgi:hypothetical protein